MGRHYCKSFQDIAMPGQELSSYTRKLGTGKLKRMTAKRRVSLQIAVIVPQSVPPELYKSLHAKPELSVGTVVVT